MSESIMEHLSNVVLTFESVYEILWCDHSNETSSVVLLHGIILFNMCISNFWDCELMKIHGVTIQNLSSCNITWYYFFSIFYNMKFGIFFYFAFILVLISLLW